MDVKNQTHWTMHITYPLTKEQYMWQLYCNSIVFMQT